MRRRANEKQQYLNKESQTMEEAILVTIDDGIATLTINRPKALNAINTAVMEGLHHWFSDGYKSVSGLSGVIITGSGDKAFAAGADITEFMELDLAAGQAKSKYGHDTYFLIERFHVPVVAAVNGFALGGGCELAMACHLRVASETAKFGQPEVNLGLIPGYGGSQRLPQLIGKGRAMELLLTANLIDAETALSYGLANRVCTGEDLLPTAHKILTKIATKGPIAIAKTIATVNAAYDESVDGYALEYGIFGELLSNAECKEGVAAFLEKRKANFDRSTSE